jgi:tRNA(Ile2) C34 agmatinyltransferase TiaS
MKVFLIMLSVAVSAIFASNLNVDYYNLKNGNKLICKITTNSYKVIDNLNSSVKVINGTTFFKIKNENIYITGSACHPVKKANTAIIF